jgi:hypothetical protein
MGDQDLQVKITAEAGSLRAGMDQATRAVRDAVSQMHDQFKGLEISAGSIGSKIGGLIAGAVTIGAFKSVIDAAMGYSRSVHELTEVLGGTAEKASVLNTALKMIGKTAEDYIGVNLKLARQIKSSEDELNQLGLTTRNSNGSLLSQTELFNNAIRTMMTYKEGTDRNQFALYAFGRSAQEVYDYQRLTNEVMQRAAEIAQKYGLVLSDQAIEQSKRFGRELNVLKIIIDSIKIAIGNQLLPELQNFSGWCGAVAPGVISAVVWWVKGMITFFEELRLTVWGVGGVFQALGTVVYDVFGGLGKALVALAKGDLAGFWTEITKGGQMAVLDWRKIDAELEADSAATHLRLSQLWSSSPMMPGGKETKGGKGTKEFVAPETKEAKSRVPDWESELEDIKESEGAFFNFSREREKEFWGSKISLTRDGTDENREVNKKLYELMKTDAKESYDIEIAELKAFQSSELTIWNQRISAQDAIISKTGELYGKEGVEYARAVLEKQKLQEEYDREYQKAIDNITNKMREVNAKRIDGEIEANNKAAEAAQEYYRKRFELGEINAGDLARVEQELEDQRFGIEMQGLEDLKLLFDSIPEKYQEILNKMKLAKEKNALDLQKIDENLAADNKRIWSEIMSPITSAISTSIKGIIMGTTTLKSALANLFQSIFLSFVDLLVKKMVEEWAVGELMKINISKIGAAIRQALTTEEAATSVATTAAVADQEISMYAGIAAAGGAASQASIPYVGPILAAAAFATIMAMVLGAKSLFSAEGGWDVDQGGMTMIHPQEMILPASLAEGIRGMVGSGGGGGGWKPNNRTFRDMGKAFGAEQGKAFVGSLRGVARNFGFKR